MFLPQLMSDQMISNNIKSPWRLTVYPIAHGLTDTTPPPAGTRTADCNTAPTALEKSKTVRSSFVRSYLLVVAVFFVCSFVACRRRRLFDHSLLVVLVVVARSLLARVVVIVCSWLVVVVVHSLLLLSS